MSPGADRHVTGPSETDRPTATRRRALSLAALGATVGLAGCGYRPGPGELDWERDRASPGGFFGSESRWLAAGDRLVEVRNRGGRTYDLDAEEWVDVDDAVVVAYGPSGDERFSAETDRQFEGTPAVDGDGVYVPRDDGRVTAISHEGDAGERLWTTAADAASRSEEPPPGLAAGGGLVAAAVGDRLVGFDAATGDERFVVESGAGEIQHAAVDDRRAWAATGGSDPTLYGFDHEGTEQVTLSLPAAARWLLTAGDLALVGLPDDGAWAVEPDGTRRFRFDIGTGRAPPTVVGDRCYHRAGGRLIAFDLGRGERVWERDDPFGGSRVAGGARIGSAGGPPVADADGVYGRGPAGDSGECGLVAVGADGESWWEVRTPDEPGCAGDLYLVGDRLVVVADGGLYGFRTAPGSRFSVV